MMLRIYKDYIDIDRIAISELMRVAEIVSVAFNPYLYFDDERDYPKKTEGKEYIIEGVREKDIEKLISLKYDSSEYQSILLKYAKWTVRTQDEEPIIYTDEKKERWVRIDLYEEYDTVLFNAVIREDLYHRLLNRKNCDDYKPMTIAELFAPIYYRLINDVDNYIFSNFESVFDTEFKEGFMPPNDNAKVVMFQRYLLLPLLYVKDKEKMREKIVNLVTKYSLITPSNQIERRKIESLKKAFKRV